MKVALKIALVLAIASLVSGPAAAEWFAHGGFEPDTPYDTADWMWENEPGAVKNRIYFSVISGYNLGGISFGKPTLNPNVGMLHTRMEIGTLEIQHAFLGVWVDCNDDGYIGVAESALREYSSALLTSTTRCPPVTGATTEQWPVGAHNYNGWVSEYIPILNTRSSFDSRIYLDLTSRVWGDFDRPDEHPHERNCPTTSFPRGALSTTGGVLNYFDCRMDLLGPWNDAMQAIGDPGQLSFPDEDNATTGRLGEVWLYGPHGAEHAAVTTVDCDEAPIVSVQTIEVRRPTPELGPATDPSDISVGGQINRTYEEWYDDCEPSNDPGHEITEFGIFSIEDADFNSVNPNNKTEANWNFKPAFAQRGATPFAIGPGAGNAGIPQDVGQGIGGTHWLSDSIWTKFGPRTVRYDLGNGDAELAPAYWMSFYAHVGSATLGRGFALPGSSPGIYGDWACKDFESGVHQGWNCDTTMWYLNADGSTPFNVADLAKPGWLYELRDVDCYDGGIGDAGVGVQPAYYGEEPCPGNSG